MGHIVNVVVGIYFLCQSLMLFGVGIPPMFLAIIALIAALACFSYPWLTRD